MKVLHVYKSYYPDSMGGIEQVIAQLGRGLSALGHENRVFTLSADPLPAVLQRPEGQVHRSRLTAEVASNPVSFAALPEFRRQLRWADVVHYQFPWPFADLLQLLNARKPSVVTYQSDIVRQKFLLRAYTPLMNHFLESADIVVATSPQYRDSSPVLGRLKSEVRVIPNGIDESTYPQPSPERVAEWRARVGEGFFLFVGVLRYYKGLDTLLQAAQGFAGQIVIAGSGPEEAALQQHAARERLDNVRFLGSVTDEDKMCLLQLSRGFVFPSDLRSEAFGMSLVEAAMSARPMVSCEIGTGTSFINVDGVTGWTVPPRDPQALRDAMHRLQDEPARALAMGAAARERFLTLFTARAMAHAYNDAYRDVISAGQAVLP
ncbi:glycosyltransferase [Ramlibacter sp. WS9]|uniref:glycosyltransferase n=1 Tax=Ramlibacter sp. WS9 TaxID=1882741 RepID=UPI0011416F4F|nr:glycosyltransferase [Ramlibacter sp. WS9]ROZ77467.1 glycosyltransferase [Ramlibacter sp. WS9]